MVPIFHQPVNPSPEVLAADAAILKAEGAYHVNGRYYARQEDASTWRRLEAEKRVREAERQAQLVCAFCFEKISGHVAVIIAQRAVHPACAREFDLWVASKPEENDVRWLSVTVETPVLFDGEMTTWGELSTYERKTVELRQDGSFVGGYGV